MQKQALRLRAFAVGVIMLVFSGWVCADPPSRVGRLGYMSGAVSFSPAGENEWDRATINRPLTSGDRLWTDARARAEIQVGGAIVRMSADTGISILNLDDRIAQLQLTQGTLNIRLRRLAPNQVFEVDTPNLALTLRQSGEYRIEVDPDDDATTIFMRKGQGEVYGEGASYVIDSRQPYRFTGIGLHEYRLVAAPRLDAFDRWASGRDRAFDNSVAARYVSQDVLGYQDLDANGTWRVDADYGNVWVPNRVATDWAPYRDGHWAWVDPWGWTWIDDAPWGFAVSHYGRWTNMRGTWGWVPGPLRSPAYYAPALVAFIGGNNFQLTISSGKVGAVAWFPLAPREVYRPSYPVSRTYFENVNRSNTVVNNTVINNSYNTYNTSSVSNVVYVNRQVAGAVIAVPTTTFAQAQPVSRAVVRVTPELLANAAVANVAVVAQTEKSVRGAAARGDQPPPRVFERPVVARSTPPAAPVGFAAQQPQLTAKPGQPLSDAARKELKPAAAAPTPVVKVVTPVQTAPPTALPPVLATDARPADGRAKRDVQKAPATPTLPVAPQLPAPVAAPPQVVPQSVAPPMPAAPTEPPRGRSEQRGNGERRARPVAPPPSPPQSVAEPKPMAPQVVAPTAPPPPAQPQPAPAARQVESRAPVAAPSAPPLPPQAQSEPRVEPRGKRPQPAASKPAEDENDKDERKRKEDKRKQKE